MKKLITALVLAAPLGATAATIDFEAIPNGGTVSNQYPEAVFSSPGSSVEVSDYGQGSWGTAAPKIACPRDSGSYCGGTMNVDFTAAVSGLTFYFTGDDFAGIDGTASIFGAGNVLLASQDMVGDGNAQTAHLMDFGAFAGVTRLELTISAAEYGLAGLAYDDFSFNTAQVPVPGTLALLAAGLVGFAARRRTR